MQFTKSVVISCAGIGSRLGLGQNKSLIKINGRTLISWQLELLKSVKDIRIVVGYQAEEIIKEVLKYRNDVIFVYNHQYFETKTGASFYIGAKNTNEYVIEWDGDLLVHPDDVTRILAQEDEFICYSEKSSEEAVFVNTDANGNVTSFSREHGNYEWTGPACIKRDKVTCAKENVFNIIEDHLPMKGILVRAYDIDTSGDYQRVSEIVKNWNLK
ncbi:MAG: NTP transferase domain-containing protein [Paludibacteraceae bacterium]|nr:NTP transferase domain-containing protein [Paludibacteraceae bacterium]